LLDWSVIAVSAGSAIYLNVNPAPYIWRTCPCDPNSVNHFDRPAIFNYNPGLYTAANITLLASIAAPIAFDAADLGFSKEFNEDMVVFLEVLSVDQAVMNTLKFIIQRPFPHAYDPNNEEPKEPLDFTAMPSGHTSMVASALAASAVTVNLRYGTNYWPWAIAAVLTTSIALELIYSGEHFASDTIVGGLIGAGVGIAIPLLHERNLALKNFYIFPVAKGAGVKYSIPF
jgi:membrane-associated phospholipid phosphatase